MFELRRIVLRSPNMKIFGRSTDIHGQSPWSSVKADKTCPRKFLINHNVELIEQTDKISLDNINDPQEYQEAIKAIKEHASKK